MKIILEHFYFSKSVNHLLYFCPKTTVSVYLKYQTFVPSLKTLQTMVTFFSIYHFFQMEKKWQLNKSDVCYDSFVMTLSVLTIGVTAGEQGGQKPEPHREMRRPSPHLLPGTETHKHIYLDILAKLLSNNSTTGGEEEKRQRENCFTCTEKPRPTKL